MTQTRRRATTGMIGAALLVTGCTSLPASQTGNSAETTAVATEASVPQPGDVTLSNGLTVPRVIGEDWVLIEKVTDESETNQKYIVDAYMTYQDRGGSGIDEFDIYEHLDDYFARQYEEGWTSQSALYRKADGGDETLAGVAWVSRNEGSGQPDAEPSLGKNESDFNWFVTRGGVHWVVAGNADENQIASLTEAVDQLSHQEQ